MISSRSESADGQPGPQHDLRLVPAAVLGWALAAWAVGRPSVVALAVAVGCLVLVALWHRPAVVVTGCLLALVGLSVAWRVAAVEASPMSAWAEKGVNAEVVLQVETDARAYRAPGGDGLVLTGEVVEATSRLGVIRSAGQVTIFVTEAGVDARDLTVGRRIRVTAAVTPAEGSSEVATLRASSVHPMTGRPWWWAASERVRTGVREAVAHQPAAPRALVPALVDGDDAAIPDDLDEDFRRSGLTHLLAVSGTNLTIIVAALLGMARAAGIGRRWWVVLGVVAVVGFVLVARPEPSVLRAAVMGLVGLAALGIGVAGGVRAIAVAVIALLAFDPWLGRSPGFVLSVCATAGIVVLAPPLIERMAWCPRWLAVAIAVPVAAQAACMPMLVALSGEVSLVAVAANLAAGPAVAPATVTGLAGGLLWLVAAPVGEAAGQVASWCASWIIAVGRTCAGFEGAAVGWGGPWWWSIPATVAVVAAGWWVMRRPALAAGVALGLGIVVVHPPDPGWPPGGWIVVACDVGQGDGLVLNAGEGQAVVVDTGMDPGPIDRCLRRLGIDHVVALVFTHADADHVAGWRGVLRGRRVDAVIVGASGGPATGLPTTQADAGDVIVAGSREQVRLDVLWPVEREPAPGQDRNDLSLVMRLEVDGVRVLLTGDVEPEAQRALLRSGADLRADVLKVPHHGSAHQDPDFIAATGAAAALISAGRDNPHGHPAPSALELLADCHMAWWRTDLQGDLAVLVREGRWSIVAGGT
ncbi:MAG: ComEC/Rec2 family competence protein [Aeromicrobium sp.]|uniref:ComEC/Rec2 family competence protein n=1 Tax=Aeromicrobium sp. TaxID=1871063 RepID=UPI0039E2965B